MHHYFCINQCATFVPECAYCVIFFILSYVFQAVISRYLDIVRIDIIKHTSQRFISNSLLRGIVNYDIQDELFMI